MSSTTNEDILRRGPVSLLFVPANRPERFAKAAASGASAVILDLEDAVAPVDKAAARAAIVSGLSGVPCVWRINAIGSNAHAEDVQFLGRMRPDAVMLPKAEAGPAFDAFAAGLSGVPIIALVESAQGIASARMLAAHPAVVGLAFGTLDFCVDVGAEHIQPVLDPMRMELVLAARLAVADPACLGKAGDGCRGRGGRRGWRNGGRPRQGACGPHPGQGAGAVVPERRSAAGVLTEWISVSNALFPRTRPR